MNQQSNQASEIRNQEQINQDNVIIQQHPHQFSQSRLIETSIKEGYNPYLLSSGSLNSRSEGFNTRNLYQNAQTILQETLQTDTANVIYSLQHQSAQKSQSRNAQSEFLEQRLNKMKEKHKLLQEQLSKVSQIESVSSQKKKNVIHSQSAVNVQKGGDAKFFNYESINNQIKQVDVISNLLSYIQINPSASRQDIEVLIEKQDTHKVLKTLTDQQVNITHHLNTIVGQRDVLIMQNDNMTKENNKLKDQTKMLEEELKQTKGALSETRVELERTKTVYDMLERKYIDLLKKKQEVKIINKETIKEVVVEKPIEIIKQVNNVKLVKQKKEIRKVIRPKPDEKHTIIQKLHVVEKVSVETQIKTIDRVVEIPKIEVVEKEKIVDRPVIIERPVDRIVEVPKIVPKEVYVNRPVYIEKPVTFQKLNPLKMLKEQLRFLKLQKKRDLQKDLFSLIDLLKQQQVDRIVEKETFVDRPVYIHEPPKVVEVPKIIEKDNYIDRPVYIEKDNYIDRPVYIDRDNYIDRPVYIDRDNYIDRPVYIDRDNYIDRPVYIEGPEKIVEVPQIIEKNNYIDRPVYVETPVEVERIVEVPKIIERDNYIEKPVFIQQQHVSYAPVSSQLVHSYKTSVPSVQLQQTPVFSNTHILQERGSKVPMYKNQNMLDLPHSIRDSMCLHPIGSHFNSVSTDYLSPQYSQYVPNRLS